MATYTGSNLTDVQSARTAENLSIREASLRRALAAIQAMSEVGRQSSAERIAGKSAANEADRLNNALTLGREQYGSQERVAGLERGSRLELAALGHTSAENVEKMRGANSLAVAKWNAMLQDPRYAGQSDQLDAEIDQLNSFATIAAAKANFALESKKANVKNMFGFGKTPSQEEVSKFASEIWSGAAGAGSDQMFYNGKEFEPIVMPKPPRRGLGLDPTAAPGLPTVPPPRPNHRMMEDSVLLTPVPVPYGPTSGTFSPPLGRVAVPVAQPATTIPELQRLGPLGVIQRLMTPAATSQASAAAPMAIPQALPPVPMNRGIVTPQQAQAWQQKAAVEAAFKQRYLDAMRAASQQYAPASPF